jgi:hypothetical protein
LEIASSDEEKELECLINNDYAGNDDESQDDPENDDGDETLLTPEQKQQQQQRSSHGETSATYCKWWSELLLLFMSLLAVVGVVLGLNHQTSMIFSKRDFAAGGSTRGKQQDRMAPTDGPTIPPVSSSSSPTTERGGNTEPFPDDPITPEHYVVYPIYDDDLSYRRVCAPLGEYTHLCLTIRYPFKIPKQDPSVPYPKPVLDIFNDQSFSLPLHIIDGKQLDYCKTIVQEEQGGTSRTPVSMSSAIKQCIDHYHDLTNTANSKRSRAATACWSYERNGKFFFYGIHVSDRQRLRMQEYFNRQIIFLFGMSPTPPIALNWQELFGGNCECKLVERRLEGLCTPRGEHRLNNWTELEDPNTNWTMIRYTSVLDPGHDEHHPVLPVLENTFRRPDGPVSSSQRLKITAVSEHPIAHLQDLNSFLNDYERMVSRTDGYIQSFLGECRNQTQLDAWNIEISKVIAFDGSPQFFPTASGAYPYVRHDAPHSEEEFIAKNGYYPTWEPEYGTKCRGFLPPNSNLTQFNALGRSMYKTYGQDMNWYGQTWEFINLVWYSMKGWHGKDGQLDCTHGDMEQVSIMHMYFLMAMVDNHYDTMEEKGET